MVKIRSTDQHKNSDTPKGEVGEIDTRAPFQSVKAAVSLFVEVAKDKEKATNRRSRLSSSENVLDKETQLLLAQRELEKYKLQLDAAETTNARASAELEKAKITLNDLTTNLKSVNECKLSAIEIAEAIKKQAKQLEVEKSQPQVHKQELDQEREQYMTLVTKLDVEKQQLTKLRQDFDSTLDAKSAAFQQAAEAQRLANMNNVRVNELVKEIRAMHESNEQLKLASAQAQEQLANIVAARDRRIEACKIAKEEVDKKLDTLRQEYDPEMSRNLEVKLVETTVGIEALQEEMRKAHAFEMSAVKFITTELNEATKTLQEVVEQEGLLRNIVTSLKLELEEVKKEKIKLQNKETVVEAKLSTETEIARREAEEINKNSDKMKQEAEKGRLFVEEGNKKLAIVLAMVEQAKEREKRAYNEMKMLSEKQKSENQESDNPNTIKMTLQEFEVLKKKVEECDNIAEAKETDALTEVEASIERKNLAEKKIEENLKAIEEIKEATEIALKSAEMAEAAQSVVEGELKRWRHKDLALCP